MSDVCEFANNEVVNLTELQKFIVQGYLKIEPTTSDSSNNNAKIIHESISIFLLLHLLSIIQFQFCVILCNVISN